ncbi:S8 family peptidase [Caldisalinibacter kiritimatiensis]|uniref:Subtilisin-like serin protease n=1 Tax=Caldisalinibacter kiritimatiensis TaxID=1304284 RepID=R1CLJ2_9FIRM|nr:S8 family serine peptidase [Caldisalinibacter kiritimatiensis]EOC99555.1 subtilisin-like serin protease precursor [Caldisalinibacter kiritimatiensis]
MKLQYKRLITIILSFILIFVQILILLPSNEVYAQSNHNSNIIPGKLIVKYKSTNENSKLSQSSANLIQEINISYNKDILQVIEELENSSNIEYVEPVFIRNIIDSYSEDVDSQKTVIKSVYEINDPEYINGYQWGLYATNIQDAWENVSIEDRNDITIAVIDTGVDLDHPDLKNSIVEGYDFVDGDTVADDEHGHGTHVAGIASAMVDNGLGIAGVAGGVNIMPIRVIGPYGATSKDIGDAIIWAADNGADVINMSLGGAEFSQYEYQAVQYAISKGVVVVAATGNESNHWIHGEKGDIDFDNDSVRYTAPVGYPAAYEGVVGVGAVDWYQDTDFIIADFSNIGEEVDVVAPGVDILSTYPDERYLYMSGTSMATPFVSGYVALILAGNNNLTVEQVTDILAESSIDLGDEGNDEYFGYGLVDGERIFNTPILDIEAVNEEVELPNGVEINLYTKDNHGTILEEVYGQAELYVERYDDNNIWFTEENISGTVVDIVYGEGNTVITIDEFGQYRIYAEDLDNNWVKSDYINVNIVEAPVVDDEDTSGDDSPVGGFTGGSPSGGGIVEEPSEEEDIVEVEDKNIQVKIDEENMVVEAVAKQDVKLIEVNIPSNILEKSKTNNKPIIIKTDDVNFKVNPKTVDINDGEELKFKISSLGNEETNSFIENKPEAINVSNVYDFELYVGDNKVENFNSSITVTIKYDKNKVSDKNKLGVYYYNEQTEEWEYVGGKVNDDRTITFETDHFSKYVVMEYNKTFDDIEGHWAKYDIEVMAAKHIAKGNDNAKFAPDNNITRAEFAALLVRALRIKEIDESSFTDVNSDAWYKEGIDKAYKAKIVNGVGDGVFNPDGNITREEMASMIMRAYSYTTTTNLDDIVTTAEVKFKDEGTVSSWARRNVRLVDTFKIMEGDPEGTFRPKDNATRAEAIVVIKRLLEIL